MDETDGKVNIALTRWIQDRMWGFIGNVTSRCYLHWLHHVDWFQLTGNVQWESEFRFSNVNQNNSNVINNPISEVKINIPWVINMATLKSAIRDQIGS